MGIPPCIWLERPNGSYITGPKVDRGDGADGQRRRNDATAINGTAKELQKSFQGRDGQLHDNELRIQARRNGGMFHFTSQSR